MTCITIRNTAACTFNFCTSCSLVTSFMCRELNSSGKTVLAPTALVAVTGVNGLEKRTLSISERNRKQIPHPSSLNCQMKGASYTLSVSFTHVISFTLPLNQTRSGQRQGRYICCYGALAPLLDHISCAGQTWVRYSQSDFHLYFNKCHKLQTHS